MLTALLLAATSTTTVIVSSDDSYHVPQVERSVLEGRCNDREIKLTEQRGKMTLAVNGDARDISGSTFAKSYLSGSYLGRFTIACRRDNKGFSLNFFGVEVPKDGSPVTVAGSINYDTSQALITDSPITRKEINLYQFNARRNQLWLP
jgi:hypothetical protein